MRTRHLCHIPIASLEAATALQREITGRTDDSPVFRMEQARGTSRAAAWLFAHVWLYTENQTLEFVRRLPEVGGQSRQTYPELMDIQPELDKLGDIRRPDLELITIAKLREFAESERVDLTGLTKKSDIIDAFENPDRRLP